MQRFLAAILVFCLCVSVARTEAAADLIVTNAKVWTVDPAHPIAEAMAVIGERIVAVGSRGAVESWHGSKTKVIDARGRLLLPGFNDAHVHFVDGGRQLAVPFRILRLEISMWTPAPPALLH